MKPDIRLSVYDFLGFVFPGFVTLASLLLAWWAITQDGALLEVPKVTINAWAVFIVVSYFLGHLIQGVANRLPFLKTKGYEVLAEGKEFSEKIVREAKQRVEKQFALSGMITKPEMYFRLWEATVMHRGSTGDRDIYQYREGFYRGATGSFILLCLCLLGASARSICSGFSTKVVIGGIGIRVDWAAWLIAAALSAGAAYLMHERHKRFTGYRVKHTVYQFLTLPDRKSVV